MKEEDELRELYLKYVELHNEYKRIEEEAIRLESERKKVREILDETREREKSIINKLEKERGVKITADDLFQMIKGHEQTK